MPNIEEIVGLSDAEETDGTPDTAEEVVEPVIVETADTPDTEEEETGCDAQGLHDESGGHILRHALWVDTSLIPRTACLAEKGALTGGLWNINNNYSCYLDENNQC